jgi:hypothetical protein
LEEIEGSIFSDATWLVGFIVSFAYGTKKKRPFKPFVFKIFGIPYLYISTQSNLCPAHFLSCFQHICLLLPHQLPNAQSFTSIFEVDPIGFISSPSHFPFDPNRVINPKSCLIAYKTLSRLPSA